MLIDYQIQEERSKDTSCTPSLTVRLDNIEKKKSKVIICTCFFFSFLELIKNGQGGPTRQLVLHPLKQAPFHPPDELIWNLLSDELM